MSEEIRLDPEWLLSLAKKEENLARPRLKVFLGMAAGVGKTYSMLQGGKEFQQGGGDVVIGIIYTHGRPETEALVKGIPMLPRKKIVYKNATFEEMDIDAILERKPKLVLIDELAHTNIEGSRHSKRWQDVMEILDAGIDVFTTLNVQHLESRKEAVEELTGISVQETVPDSVLERATEIELVDYPPTQLLQRLAEGKVYVADQSKIAVQNFFTEDNLTVLREISLRTASERVGHDIKTLVSPRAKETREGVLLAAIDQTLQAEHVLRISRTMAYNLNLSWIALYVDDGRELSPEENKQLEKNCALARELGAEVLTTVAADYKEGILRIALLKGAVYVALGNSKKTFFQKMFMQETLSHYLLRKIPYVHLHILKKESVEKEKEKRRFSLFRFFKDWSGFWRVVSAFLFLVVLGHMFTPLIGYQGVSVILLLGVFILSLFVKPSSIVLVNLATICSLYFFFIPPVGEIYLEKKSDLLFFTFYTVTLFCITVTTSFFKKRERFLHSQEDEAQILFDIVKDISGAPTRQATFEEMTKRLGQYLHGESAIALKEEEYKLKVVTHTPVWKNEKEESVALWTMKNGKSAGWSTETLSSVPSLFIPLKGLKEVYGVLSFRPFAQQSLSVKKMNFLTTIAHELGAYLERFFYEEKERNAYYLQQAESFQQEILQSIGHEFSKPIEVLIDISNRLEKQEDVKESANLQKLKKQMIDSVEILHRLTKNFLDMAHLSSGLLQIQMHPNEGEKLIYVTLDRMKKQLKNHHVVVTIEKNLPKVLFDFTLMTNALENLLMNAIIYSAEGKTIEVVAKKQNGFLEISVLDEGRGIPQEELTQVFKKFYRLPGTKAIGSGLGLAIVKAIIDIHKGKIRVQSRLSGGTEFCLILPLIIA